MATTILMFSCSNNESPTKVNTKAETEKPITVDKKEPVVEEESNKTVCSNCGEEYTKGEGYFYYREFGKWHCFREEEDVLNVAYEYYCSRRCARDNRF